MKIRQIMALTGATVVCGNGREDHEVQCAFASDLMSDVLTLDCNGVLLVTGLCNMQTIRTAEMADVSCILFVRGKKATPDILQLAAENEMILMETDHSMYHTVGELYLTAFRRSIKQKEVKICNSDLNWKEATSQKPAMLRAR